MIDEAQRRSENLGKIKVTIVSDFSVHEWSTARIERLMTDMRSSHSDLEIDFDLQGTNNGMANKASSNSIANLSIVAMEVRDTIQAPGRAEIRVAVRNTGTEPSLPTKVQLWLDGRMAEENQLQSLGVGDTGISDFFVTRSSDSTKLIEMRLSSDQLLLDNVRYARLLPSLRGKATIISTKEMDALGLQAACTALGIEATWSPDVDALNDDANSDLHLIDPSHFDEKLMQAIDSQLREGNHVYVWLGESLDTASLDVKAITVPTNSLSLAQNDDMSLRQLAIGLNRPDTSSTASSEYLSVPIRKFWQLENIQNGWEAVIRFDDQIPFAVSRSISAGAITYFVTPPKLEWSGVAEEWNALAKWPTFVPLFDQVRQADVNRHAYDCVAGQSLELTLFSKSQWAVDAPNGRRKMLPTLDAQQEFFAIQYSDTDQLGLYHVRSLQNSLTEVASNNNIDFVVNLDPAEIEFETAELPSNLAGSPQERPVTFRPDNTVPLFRWLLSIAIGALLLENIIATAAATRKLRAG